MEKKDNSSKIIAIVALFVAVVGLSIGFASFSETLTISSNAEVNPSDEVFNVDFSTVTGAATAGSVTPTLLPNDASFTASNATIDNTNSPTITGLKATFTAPGQSATYSFFVTNIGDLEAFLNTVTFANANGADGFKSCISKPAAEGVNPATQDLVDDACGDISLTLTIDEDTYTSSNATITGKSLAAGNTSIPVTVKIEYAANGAVADGDFIVNFGDITLTYSSVD